MSLPVAILAGGLATRLRPVTEKIPKALVPVAGKPFLAHQLGLLRSGGVRRVILCVGHLGEMIEREFGSGRDYGVELEYSHDGEKLRETGGALKRALPLLGEKFLVLYGDSYLRVDYAAAARAFVESGKPGLMTVYRNEGRWERSNVLCEEGRILAYDKRNPVSAMRHIDYGLCGLSAAVVGGEAEEVFDLSALLARLAEQGELAAWEAAERFYEIGSPEGLAELDSLLAGR